MFALINEDFAGAMCLSLAVTFSKLELLREVVFERELQMKVVRLEAIQEILSFAVDQFAADHDVVDGEKQDVARGIMAAMESVRFLPIRVLDVQDRVSDRAGEALIPGMIEIGHRTED